jgi:hypothetical protein
MTESSFKEQCSDLTQSMTIEIPCGLVERAEKYTKETGATLSGVIIEALDAFLRGRNTD